MKFIVFILFVYALVLSVTPCCPDDNCNETDGCVQAEQTEKDHHDTDCRGTCSPFFTCGSCSGFVCETPSYSLAPLVVSFSEFLVVPAPMFHSEILHSIWQPPKVC